MIDHIDDDFNKRQYEDNLQGYLDLNQDEHIGGGNTKTRTALVEKFLPPGSRLLEIGSGAGVDALALQAAGYEVTASDYSEKFVNILTAAGLDARLFDAKQDKLPGNFDAIYANAVFVHFTHDEFKNFLTKAKESLSGGRIIYFSVIQGEGMERRTIGNGMERDFQYYSQPQILETLNFIGYKILSLELVNDRWIQVVAQLTND